MEGNQQENKVPEQEGQQQESGEGSGTQEGKLFTQEEVNNIIKNRLERQKKKDGEDMESGLAVREQELNIRENRLKCKEYVSEKGLPKEFLEILDTSDEESFREKADRLSGIMGNNHRRAQVPPMRSNDPSDGYGADLASVFSPAHKHVPRYKNYEGE